MKITIILACAAVLVGSAAAQNSGYTLPSKIKWPTGVAVNAGGDPVITGRGSIVLHTAPTFANSITTPAIFVTGDSVNLRSDTVTYIYDQNNQGNWSFENVANNRFPIIAWKANGTERLRFAASGGVNVGATDDPGVGAIKAKLVVRTGYAVAALPVAAAGAMAFVSDATACTFNAPVSGGGSSFCPVIYNGSAWVGG